jgi:hypothetical protein
LRVERMEERVLTKWLCNLDLDFGGKDDCGELI